MKNICTLKHSFYLSVLFMLNAAILFISSAGQIQRTEKIDSLIIHAIDNGAFPGAVVLVGDKNSIIYHKAFGAFTYDQGASPVDEYTIYDIASMTKVVATTSTIMHLFDNGAIHPDDTVTAFIPGYTNEYKQNVTIKDLLLHTGGLPSWKEFYSETASRSEMIRRVIETPLETAPGTHYQYSDLGMILLGEIVERISGIPIDQYASKYIFEPLEMNSTMFNPPQDLRDTVAPTEIDTLWRRELVHGFVHDENAYRMDGVAGHAGLFSNAPDLAGFAQMMLRGGELKGTRIFSSETVRLFTSRYNELSSRAFGWDTKTEGGYSSAGTRLSPASFGHTGFTGTSIWIDPEQDIFIVFLTNRVHPVRVNTEIVHTRPDLHDLVIEVFRSTDS